MSKTYEALVKAEQLRASHDPAALARRVARAAEEGESLRAELRVFQEQLTALIERVDAAAGVDDDLGRQVARLAAQQERASAEPRQLVDAAIQQLREELNARFATAQSQSHQVARLSTRFKELQQDVVPTVQGMRGAIEQLQRRAQDLQSEQLSERQTFAAAVESLHDAISRVSESFDEQQREQRRLQEEIAAVRAAQQANARQSPQLAALTESFESVRQRLDEVETRRRSDAERLQAEVRSLHQGIETLKLSQSETDESRGIQAATAESLRAELGALREQLTALHEETRRFDPHLQEPIAQQAPGMLSLSEEAMRAVHESVDSLQAAQRGLVERLAAIEELQSRGDRRLHDMLAAIEPLRTEHARSAEAMDALRVVAGDVDALRAHVSKLADLPSRQQQLAANIERAEATAQQAARRATEIDASHASSLASLQHRVAELKTDSSELRDALKLVQSVLVEQRQVGIGLDQLRAQVEPLIEAQARQEEIAEAVSRAQDAVDEAAHRIATNEETQHRALGALHEQIDALQTDLGPWREVSATVESLVVTQRASAGELENLRTRVSHMLDAQRRQQQLFEELLLAPVTSGDSSIDGNAGESMDLASLRRQVVALQADRLNLDAFLENRFEVLCEILDAEMEEKLGELRGGTRLRVSARPSQRLRQALGRFAASIPGLRKKPD